MTYRVLDLFCGAGGSAMGLHRAWPDAEIVGVDIVLQKRYPFTFVQGDALTFPLDGFDFIWASPPCQDYIPTIPRLHGTAHYLPDTRAMLDKLCVPWVIENIPGAPLRADYRLCGCMFGLPRLRRQRLFETSWNGFSLLPPCKHDEHPISVTGHGVPSGNYYRGQLRYAEYVKLARAAMGIDWMSRDELSQAIPPAYSEYIARQIRAFVPECRP